jgi:hypothetical protein
MFKVDERSAGWQNQKDYILHRGRRWFSTAKNWRAERQQRLETGITDPYINPQTGLPYTKNAQTYRHGTVWQRLYTDEQIVANPTLSTKYFN